MDEQHGDQATVRPMSNPHNRRLVIGLTLIFGLMLVSSLVETVNKERGLARPASAPAAHPAASTPAPATAPAAAVLPVATPPAVSGVRVYADPLTGCQYLIAASGITPRLTPAGTPYCRVPGAETGSHRR